MTGVELRQALRSGRRVYGTCVLSTSPNWPGMIASLGLDFVFIDTEHVAIDRSALSWMCRMYGALGLAPIVRVPEPDPYRACMVLDGGAAGVIAPYVESVDEVRRLLGATRLRPLKGRRLNDILNARGEPEPELAAYLEARNEGTVAIINLESTPALEALGAILAEPGLDAVLIGPHDLSVSLGVPEQYDHPRFNTAVSTIIRETRARDLGVGIHFSDGIEREIGWAREGANFIVHSSDIALVREAMAADFTRFRRELRDS